MSSSRRNSGEIHILAMLDRQSGNSKRFRVLSRAAWYGAGGMLACLLLGGAAWMMHDQAGGGFEGRIAAGPPSVPLEIAAETLPNPALQIDEPRTHGAAIVDLPVAGPAEAAAAPASAPAPAPAHAEAPAARTDTPEANDRHGAAPARPATAPATRPTVAHAAPRPASRTAPAPRQAAGHARQEPAHPRRTAALPKAKPAPGAVDTDVALISAIIQHVNQRGELKDDAAKMPNRP